ncbi:uncharacterized protein LOC141620853 [Silene latifolia]|uniref:uncharacterized protein LOC141620853 n=1 Tax=Silene latifolia TaxID=37657 RepID=UPI003D788647
MAAHQLDLDNLHDVLPLRRLIISNNNYDLQSPIDDLNDTLLELIFIRIVQWRHLVTCKCVSKRWNFIISNPDFARYLAKKHSPFTLILRKGRAAYHCLITEHPYFQTHNLRLNDITPINIVANHNDILVDFRPATRRAQLVYNITNPLTKQFIVVPLPSEILFYYTSEQNCKIGFAGFVDGVSTIDNVPNSKNDVMGFRIIPAIMSDQNKLIWHIYSSETGKWNKYSVNDLGFKFKTDEICYPLDDQALTLNNKIHWRGRSNKILVIDPFVVEDNNVLYCVLNLPSAIQEDSVLCSCRNRLRIAQLKSNKIGLRIKIWEFDDVYDDMINSGCNTMANVRLVINFLLKPNLIDRHFNPFHGEGLFSINLRCTQNKMICCHPNDPDTVYFVFKDKLVECDVVKSRLRVISDCTTTNWSRLFMLVHPLPALQ